MKTTIYYPLYSYQDKREEGAEKHRKGNRADGILCRTMKEIDLPGHGQHLILVEQKIVFKHKFTIPIPVEWEKKDWDSFLKEVRHIVVWSPMSNGMEGVRTEK